MPRAKPNRPRPIRRKTMEGVDDSVKFKALQAYSKGKRIPDIAEELNISKTSLDTYLSIFCHRLITLFETKALVAKDTDSHQRWFETNRVLDPETINESFMKLISGPREPLTDHEQLYCFLYSENGCDNTLALRGSGLDAGFSKAAPPEAFTLRGQFLRNKKNIKDEIVNLRQRYTQSIAVDVDTIRTELMDIIVQLKNKGSNYGQLINAVKLLGQTGDLFQTNVNVSTTSPKEELERLITMVKKDSSYHASP